VPEGQLQLGFRRLHRRAGLRDQLADHGDELRFVQSRLSRSRLRDRALQRDADWE
jgi:hypothetical protein